jgi:hypothetical protein
MQDFGIFLNIFYFSIYILVSICSVSIVSYSIVHTVPLALENEGLVNPLDVH